MVIAYNRWTFIIAFSPRYKVTVCHLSFFIATCGRDIGVSKVFSEEKLSKFMSTTDTSLILSDLALEIWSLTMLVNG